MKSQLLNTLKFFDVDFYVKIPANSNLKVSIKELIASINNHM